MTVIGKTRLCSCCGAYYREWKEQDIEGNNCSRCTVWVLRGIVKRYHDSVELLCSRLKPENAEKLRKSPFLMKRYYVEKAFEKGILTWHIE